MTENPFTFYEHMVDFLGALVFAAAVYYSIKHLFENEMTVEGKIKYVFIILIALMHVFQVVVQITVDNFASFAVWDLINYTTAMFLLALSHRVYKRETI